MDFNKIANPYLDNYPDIFKELEKERLFQIKNGRSWNKSVYMPMGSIFGVALNLSKTPTRLFENHVYDIASLASWRFGGKHIVEFDELLELLVTKTGLHGDIPVDILLNLPFMCSYVKTKQLKDYDGFFVSLSTGNERRYEKEKLRLEISFISSFIVTTLSIDMEKVGVEEIINGFVERFKDDYPTMDYPSPELHIGESENILKTSLYSMLNYALPLILYLCAANAEITSKTATAPSIPTLPRNKRAIAPHQPTEWLCGERIGAAIRASAQREATDPTGTGVSKRPHIRRAHWHTYRVGVGKANTILKWIHPLAINADNGSDMPVTTRKV